MHGECVCVCVCDKSDPQTETWRKRGSDTHTEERDEGLKKGTGRDERAKQTEIEKRREREIENAGRDERKKDRERYIEKREEGMALPRELLQERGGSPAQRSEMTEMDQAQEKTVEQEKVPVGGGIKKSERDRAIKRREKETSLEH